MRQLAIYGKGGIGKSMVASHITYAFAAKGKTVMHMGCDPKHDSTRLLTGGRMITPILDVLRRHRFDLEQVALADLVMRSPLSDECPGAIHCAESGGPEAGVGCGGRGVAEAITALKTLRAFTELHLDVVVYDVLGDVVCGGFATPIRDGHAKEIYVVTSGEIEVLFAAANIFKAIARFNAKSGTELGGIIGNLRNMNGERELLARFAEHMGTRVVGYIPYSETIKECSGRGATLFQYAPESAECAAFRELCDAIENNQDAYVPRTISFDELHAWWRANR